MANRNLLVEVVLTKSVGGRAEGSRFWAIKRLGRRGRRGSFWLAIDPVDGSQFRLSNTQARKADPGAPGVKEVPDAL